MQNEVTWTVSYYNDRLQKRVPLTWGITEDEAVQQAEIAASIGLREPRAERADKRNDDK